MAIDFAKLSGLKKTTTVRLRGEVRETTEVERAEEMDEAGKVTKPAVMKKEFTGVTLTVRALSALETLIVHNAFDKPQPPMMKSEFTGSNAPEKPNIYAPAYDKGMREYRDKVDAAAVAVACGHTVGDKAFEGLPAAEHVEWLRKAADEIRTHLTDAEIDGVVKASQALGDINRLVETSLKN